MANTFKSAATGSSNVIGAFYTCPAATTAVVHAIYLSNVDGTNDATIDIANQWPLIGIGGVNRKVVFGTACQRPDGKWFEKQ